METAGPIDVLINNAGIGLLSALEGVSMETIREVFEMHTLGAIAVTRAVLPQFRQRRAGVIFNVMSSVTLKSLPLLFTYPASKTAINEVTQSLVLEFRQFNVRGNLMLPARALETRFGENAQPRMQGGIPEAYAALVQSVFAERQRSPAITREQDVAEAIWRAANDPRAPSPACLGRRLAVGMRALYRLAHSGLQELEIAGVGKKET